LLPGGGFGVDLFLVLSGFLITTLLLREWRARESISLRNFYARRALRLLPALFLFYAVYVFVMIGLRSFDFTGSGDVWSSVRAVGFSGIYVWNWAIVFGIDVPKGISHLWTLSIEEQFYILWPPLLLVLLRMFRDLRIVAVVTAGLIALSLSVPFFVIEGRLETDEWRRLYYGSDFRAHGLLLGSLTALLIAMGAIGQQTGSRWWFHALFAFAVYQVGLYFFTGNNRHLSLYLEGDFLRLSLACSVVVAYAALLRGGAICSLLAAAPLVYIGRRSYAMYLWHLVIAYWLRDLAVAPQFVVGALATVLAAEVSYQLVERRALALKGRFANRSQRPVQTPVTPPVPVLKPAEEAA
jgi:peptidoglycan/LPS O-acetylase OafA/YrhL